MVNKSKLEIFFFFEYVDSNVLNRTLAQISTWEPMFCHKIWMLLSKISTLHLVHFIVHYAVSKRKPIQTHVIQRDSIPRADDKPSEMRQIDITMKRCTSGIVIDLSRSRNISQMLRRFLINFTHCSMQIGFNGSLVTKNQWLPLLSAKSTLRRNILPDLISEKQNHYSRKFSPASV